MKLYLGFGYTLFIEYHGTIVDYDAAVVYKGTFLLFIMKCIYEF